MKLWEWADKNVWLENKAAAEAGPYRSAKTPWTRRLQEIIQRPEMFVYDFVNGSWIKVAVNECNEIKSSQSGVSEACLNGIRYKANFRPCNVIYAIDTREEAKNISERLLPTLEKLDTDVFTGDDDDVGTYVMRLRAMDLWFLGSFSSGKFANKQAPLVIADELEEHGISNQDTTTDKNLSSRKKTAPNGLQINVSKPKKTGGPIHKGWERGNREEFNLPCPHCGHMQWLTFFSEEREVPFGDEIEEIRDEQSGAVVARLPRPLNLGETRKIKTGRIVFEHCKDLLGQWDKLRITRETYFECADCKGRIDEHYKPGMLAGGEWRPTAHGTPGIISQHINDLYSTDPASSWGQIVLEYLDAKREGRKELQGFYNHRLGLAWQDELSKTDISTIKANIAGREGDGCPPYKRGTIPFVPRGIVIGSDVGGNYAKWAVGALAPNLVDIAIFDWGEELDPSSIADIMARQTWLASDGKNHAINVGFMDAKFRKTDAQKASFLTKGKLMTCAGLGGAAARTVKLFAVVKIPQSPLHRLDFNDREAKDEFYIERLKKKRKRIFFPIDVEQDKEFISELCAEELIVDENNRTKWNEHPGANHYGDCCKLLVTGFAYLTRRIAAPVDRPEEANKPAPVV